MEEKAGTQQEVTPKPTYSAFPDLGLSRCPQALLLSDLELQPSGRVGGGRGDTRQDGAQGSPTPTQGGPVPGLSADWEDTDSRATGPSLLAALAGASHSPVSRAAAARAAAPSRSSLGGSCSRQASIRAMLRQQRAT